MSYGDDLDDLYYPDIPLGNDVNDVNDESDDEDCCDECEELLGEDDSGNVICVNEECPRFMLPLKMGEE